jgi:hypothetical protein
MLCLYISHIGNHSREINIIANICCDDEAEQQCITKAAAKASEC